MATHKSAEKRHRQSLKRRDRNRAAKSALKTKLKKARTAIDAGAKDEAASLFRIAESSLAKAASRGVLHKRTAARKIKRLAKALNQTAAS